MQYEALEHCSRHPNRGREVRLTAVSREGLEEKYQTLDLDSPAWEEQALQYLARKDPVATAKVTVAKVLSN